MNGADYYQNVVLWSLPAALARRPVDGPTEVGNIVDRIASAAADSNGRSDRS